MVKVTVRKQKKSGRITWKRWSMWRTSGDKSGRSNFKCRTERGASSTEAHEKSEGKRTN